MRKRFPAPRALGGRSYADRYSESRKLSTKERSNSNSNLPQKKLILGTTPINFGPSVKTPSSTGLLFMLGVLVTTIVFLSILVWIVT